VVSIHRDAIETHLSKQLPKTRKIQVAFTPDQTIMLERLKGSLGKTYAEVVRNIVLAWLAEKSFIKDSLKERR